jgi:transcriptional regulator with XRE-family HTH domain
MRLAKMILLYLAANNLSQKVIANQLDISESSFSRYLSGDSGLDAASFMKLISWVSSTDSWNDGYGKRLDTLEAKVKAMEPSVMWGMKVGGSFGEDNQTTFSVKDLNIIGTKESAK